MRDVRLLDKLDLWFVYALPWVCAASFFTKKYLLVGCATIIIGRCFFVKTRQFQWVDGLVFLTLNAWLIVAAMRVHFLGIPLSYSAGGGHAYDFKRSFLISLSFFVCGNAVIQKQGFYRSFELFAIALGSAICLFACFLLVYDYRQIFYLYPLEWRFNHWFSWGFDDVCGMLGVWFFVMVALRKNSLIDGFFYIAGILLFLSMGRRPTIFFAIFLLLPILKEGLCQRWKPSIRNLRISSIYVLSVLVGSALILCGVVVEFLWGAPLVQRLLWTLQGGWKQDGRLALLQCFVDQFSFTDFFGARVNAAEITNGLESFHNLVLDGFWYGGWVGGGLAILGIVVISIQALKSKSYVGLVVMLFIILGLLLAAPPFSNQFAFALVLPLFLQYLRDVKSNKLENL